MRQRFFELYGRILIYLFIVIGLLFMLSLQAAGSSESRGMEAVFSEDIRSFSGGREVKVISAQVTDYTGYGRHVDGKKVSGPEDLQLSVSIDGGYIRGRLGNLSDYEDWKVQVIVRATESHEDEDRHQVQTHTDRRFYFSGTTGEECRCFDAYELSEKIKKYDSVYVAADITLPEDVGTIVLDGEPGPYKRKVASFDKISITGEKAGITLSGKSTVIEVKEGVSAGITDLGIDSAKGYCIDNGGSQFSHTCDSVIVVSGHHDMSPKVDLSKASCGHSLVELSGVTLDSKKTAVYNGGKVVLKGRVSISAGIGLYNMGTVDAASASLQIDAHAIGVSNASWLGIVMDSLHRKDGSYTDKELPVLASSLSADLTEYIPGGVSFVAGGGDTYICAYDTAIVNGGILELGGGRVSGGMTGIDNSGSFTFKGGSVSGGRFGIYQNGTLLMTEGAAVKSDSVLHLTTGHIILFKGGCSASLKARVSLADGDRTLGREIIRRYDDRMDLTGELCGDTANGIIPQNAPFRPAFDTVKGHTAVFRKGFGSKYNGKPQSVYLSAAFHATYKDGLDCPLSSVRTETPEDTVYFWREKQIFKTDITEDKGVVIYHGDDEISATFTQLSWRDNEGDHKERISRVYDKDHVFTATWDMALGVTYHGDHDTDISGADNKGSRDFSSEALGKGDVLFSNMSSSKAYFIREEKKSGEGSEYTQRYKFKGWDMGGRLYKPSYVISGFDFLYDALRAQCFTLKKRGDSSRVFVDMKASWNAFPSLGSRDVYLYDKEFSDKADLMACLLSTGCSFALDREDGVIDKDSVYVYTDPVDKRFEPEAFYAHGGSGCVRVYYSAEDSDGNITMWPGDVWVMTSDDQDLDITCNKLLAHNTPCGGSNMTEDSSIAYVRFIGRDSVNSLLPASVWRDEYKESLEGALSNDVSNDRVYYSPLDLQVIGRAIEEDRQSGELDIARSKEYLKIPSDISGDDNVYDYRTGEGTGDDLASPEKPAVRLLTGISGGTSRITVLFSRVKNAGGYEIQRCRSDSTDKETAWEKIAFLTGESLVYDRMDDDLDAPMYVYHDNGVCGVYRYRVRAYLSLKGQCDESMPCGKWSKEAEAGYVAPVTIDKAVAGIRSIYFSWKPVPGAVGYVIRVKGKGEDEKIFFVDGAKSDTILTKGITDGEYKISVYAYTGSEVRYYSLAADTAHVNVTDAPAPEAVYSKGRIKWKSIPGVIRYEIVERSVSDGSKRAYDFVSGCSIRVSVEGLYEYKVKAVYERLDGKEICSESEYVLAA